MEEIFSRIHPTEEEIEKCRTCKNEFVECENCFPDDSRYEKKGK